MKRLQSNVQRIDREQGEREFKFEKRLSHAVQKFVSWNVSY